MTKTIRLQGDSNAHDRPWRIAVEQGFFKAEGLNVEYHEDNPKGVAGRVENFSERWKESQLQAGALDVYPVCEWGAIERVQQLGAGKIIGLDTTARTGAIMVRKDSKITSLAQLAQRPDRGDLACRHLLRRGRGAGRGRRAVRRDQARACQRPARRPALGQERSGGADGAAGEPRLRGRLPQALRPALARRHRRQR